METLTKTATEISSKVDEAPGAIVDAVSNGISQAISEASVAAVIQSDQPVPSTDLSTTGPTDEALSCAMTVDFSNENICKMVFVGAGNWQTTNLAYTILASYNTPQTFLTAEDNPVAIKSKFFAYLRCGYHFRLTVNAPPGVSGSLGVFWIPGGTRTMVLNNGSFSRSTSSLLSLPHSLIDIRCSNQADLAVPYCSYTNYTRHPDAYSGANRLEYDGGTVLVVVFSPIRIGQQTGAIHWTLFGQIINDDFQCPRPITQGKSKLDMPKRPHVERHVLVDATPGTINPSNCLATSVSESLSLVGESTAYDFATAGADFVIRDLKQLARHWTVLHEGSWGVNNTAEITRLKFEPFSRGVMGVIGRSFQYFRGSLEVMVLTYGSSFSTGRYMLCWYPDIDNPNAVAFAYNRVRNSMYVTADIGCAPSILTLPFTHYAWRKATNTPYGFLGLYVVNKLTVNQTAPAEIDYKILVRIGPDAEFFCPIVRPLLNQGLGDDVEPVSFINYELDFIQIQSASHSLTSNFYGRLNYFSTQNIGTSVTTYTPNPHDINALNLFRCVAYWTGEMVVALVNNSPGHMWFAHKYSSETISTEADIMGIGAIIVPPNGAKTVNIPFYSPSPFRLTANYSAQHDSETKYHNALGSFYFLSTQSGKVHINVGFRNLQLAFPLPAPISSTPRSVWVHDVTEDGDVESNPGPISERVVTAGEGYYFYRIQKWRGVLTKNYVLYVSYHLGAYPSPAVYSRHTVKMGFLWSYRRIDTIDLGTKQIIVKSSRGLFRPVCSKIVEYSFQKDLTTEGVEPNPGPRSYDVINGDQESISSRTWDSDDLYYWENHYFKKKNYTANLHTVHLKSNGIPSPPVFVSKTTITKTFKHIYIRTTTIVDTPAGRKIFRSHLKTHRWLPKGSSQWVEDLTQDGDVEQNPGPYWRSTKNKFHHSNGVEIQEVLCLMTRCTGQEMFMGSSIIISKFWRNDGARKLVIKFTPPVGTTYTFTQRCHEACWVRNLTQDGDVESNPGPWITSHGRFEQDAITVDLETLVLVEVTPNGVEMLGPCIMIRCERRVGGARRRIIEYYPDFAMPPNRWETRCHEACWVRDLTMDGDVEHNPGPWSPDTKTVMVLGASRSGKSYVANKIIGAKVFFEKHSDKAVAAYCDEQHTHGNLTVIEACQEPKLQDFIDAFIFVHTPNHGSQEEQSLIAYMDNHYPNWQAHCIFLVNQRFERVHPEMHVRNHQHLDKILFKMMGRITDCPSVALKMANHCISAPYHSHFFRLVYRNRGAYRHYGVKCGTSIYHINTADILKSALKGKASVLVDYNDGGWIEEEECSYRSALNVVNAGAVELDFNIDSNCETWAKTVLSSTSGTQGGRLKWCLSVAAAAAFLFSGITLEDQSPGLFQKIIGAISSHFYATLENLVIRTVIRTVCRIICYLILYCHSPNLLTTGVIIALISMDVTSLEIDPKVKTCCESLANGEFAEFCSNVIDLTGDPDYVDLKKHIPKFNNHSITLQRLRERAIHDKVEEEDNLRGFTRKDHDPDCKCYMCREANKGHPEGCQCFLCRDVVVHAEDQGPKGFNDWTTAAKNVKWWVESLIAAFEWLREKIFPERAEKLTQELESRTSEIALSMALADEHITRCRTDKSYVLHKDTPRKHALLVDRLVAINVESLPSQLAHFQAKVSNLLTRMQAINLEPPLDFTHRPEPLGIWIQGSPGCGKSFLSTFIVRTISKKYGWTPYAHPIGSDHMDGYVDQEIHVFDDLGQNRQEQDIALMCNLISSVPFIVPKANLESKGCKYNGRLVIATTNKRDFTSNVLLETSALQRRFPIIIEIRPREKYRREDNAGRSRFNAVNATMDRSLESGECWEMNTDAKNAHRTQDCWIPLNPNVLIDEICQELDSRTAVCTFMNQGKDIKLESDELTEFDKLFPTKPKRFENFKSYVADCITSFKSFVDRNRSWFIAAGALGTVISLASFAIPYIRKWMRRDGATDENFYAGKPAPFKLRDYKLPLSNQGPVNMKPIMNSLVNVVDAEGHQATALAIGSKTIVTYSHDPFIGVSNFRDEKVEWKLTDPTKITINGEQMDLAQYQVSTNIQFKNVNPKIYNDDYQGDGYLVWKEGSEYLYLPVTSIHPTNTVVTVQGTSTRHTYTYTCRTWKGLCGAVLVGIVSGNPKILGIHVAGSKCSGTSARLFPMFDQGKARQVSTQLQPYHQPRRSKLAPSPLMDEHPKMGPAVLSNKDCRLEVPIPDITKHAAAKYVGNHFDPPKDLFTFAKSYVTSLLSRVVRPCGNITFDEAITSEILPIDWQTSPGHKFFGCSKLMLTQDPEFRHHVEAILNGSSTYFTCYLKDELRSTEKIKLGKTRAIEAANWDYVVAWRMVMGNVARQLYDDVERQSGFAPGINPFTHWDSLMDNVKPNVLALDFKGYDGSLSPQVMEAAVQILSAFHFDPQQVVNIHKPTIYSTNFVSDEIWEVEGGMCSGSPATTVLNTVVNLLVNHTVMFSYGLQPSELYICGYGDDTIISTDRQVDVSDMAERYLSFFGMSVTGADKSNTITWMPKSKTEFLKRTISLYPGTQKIVGKLDLDNMLEHIKWTRGDFQSQLDSFYQELVLHGPTVYNRIRDEFAQRAPHYKHPTFQASDLVMRSVCLIF